MDWRYKIAEANLPQTEEALLERLAEKETAVEEPKETVTSETELSATDTQDTQLESATDAIPDENLPSEEDFLQAVGIADDTHSDSTPF